MRTLGILLLTAAVFCSLSLAQTTDKKLSKTAKKSTASQKWTGFYVGGNLGGMWGSFKDPMSVPGVTAFGATLAADSVPFKDSSGSATGGFQGGYRWQFKPFVVGVEGNFNILDMNKTAVNPTNGAVTFVKGDSFTAQSRWASSIRGTFGFPWRRWLVYGTGGFAFANAHVGANFIQTIGQDAGGNPATYPASSGSSSRTLVGGTVGAGFARMVNKRWNVGAEYRYSSYAARDFSLGSVAAIANVGATAFASVPATGHVNLKTHEVAFKVNYQFKR